MARFEILQLVIFSLAAVIVVSLAVFVYLRQAEPTQPKKSLRDIFKFLSDRQNHEVKQNRGQQAETRLRESELKYRTLTKMSPVGIFRTDPAGVTTYVNPMWCEISGLTCEEAVGNGWLRAVHPNDRLNIEQEWQRASQTGTESVAEYRFLHPDGSVTWVIGQAIPETNDRGEVVGYVGTITDITAQKEAESAIRESGQRFRQLFHASPDAIFLLDPHDPEVKWSIVDCNKTACEMTGYSRQELIGQSIYLLDTHYRDEHELQEYLHNAKSSGTHYFETVHRHRDGRTYPVEVSASIFTYEGRELVLGIDRDITARKLAEAALEQRARELETLYQTSLEVNAQSNLDTLLRAIVERAALLIGVESGALFLLDPDRQTLTLTLAHNSPDTLVGLEIKLGEGLSGRVAKTGKVLAVDDYQGWEGRLDTLDGIQLRRSLAVPLMVQKRVIGVITIMDRTREGAFTTEEIRLVNLFADQAAIAVENATLYRDLQNSNFELATAYDATIEGWSKALDLRDKETEGHTLRVTALTMEMAGLMDVDEDDLVHIRRGALLHDIGKMGVPDRILFKPDSLSEDEWEIMFQHPVFAHAMLSPIEFLRPALDIPYCHHEKWDGSGYPRKLIGEEIPLAARIFAVADVWDALTSDRPYRPAWTEPQALDYISRQSGKQFDPQVVEVFLQMIAEKNKPSS